MICFPHTFRRNFKFKFEKKNNFVVMDSFIDHKKLYLNKTDFQSPTITYLTNLNKIYYKALCTASTKTVILSIGVNGVIP